MKAWQLAIILSWVVATAIFGLPYLILLLCMIIAIVVLFQIFGRDRSEHEHRWQRDSIWDSKAGVHMATEWRCIDCGEVVNDD
jgi:hypothetical protein